ncbi:MAG TPA: hypothetical protein VFC24_16785, partial [Casimicrobiaceae bacterium]|nr:hypothetical protein [Casimicrobiaceae bacterium]
MLLPYREHTPSHGDKANIADSAALIGRTQAGSNLVLRSLATLRGDGESIVVGDDVFFDERATVHIADGLIPSAIGHEVTVGKYALVHACTLDDGVVVGDAAVVMDGASVGAYAVIAAGSLVPPRKELQGGFLYAGNPAVAVRAITREEVAQWAAAIRAGSAGDPVLGSGLPALALSEIDRALASGATPHIHDAYVAPTAVVVGDVVVHADAGIFFGCIVAAGDGHIEIGAGTNIQDNSLLVTNRARGDLVIGEGVTVGHNARVGAAHIGDDALVGMGSELADGVVVKAGGCVGARSYVEPGTVVEQGWIWAGRPARAFREVKASERQAFARFRDIYIGYSSAYR